MHQKDWNIIEQELSNIIARQNMTIESLEEQLKQQHTLYNEE